MTPVFVDTFYLLAMADAGDDDHVRALEVSATLTVPTVTTVWVLAEVANAMADRTRRGAFTRIWRGLRADPLSTIVAASQSLFDQGLDLYFHRTDKDWSLTDCISFVVMKQFGITQALTADRHFEQAGFVALLN